MIYYMRSRSTGGNFFHQQVPSDAKDMSTSATRTRRCVHAVFPAAWVLMLQHEAGGEGRMDPTMRFWVILINGLVVKMIADFFWKLINTFKFEKRHTVVSLESIIVLTFRMHIFSPSGCSFQTQNTKEKSPFHAVFDCQFLIQISVVSPTQVVMGAMMLDDLLFLAWSRWLMLRATLWVCPTATKKLWRWNSWNNSGGVYWCSWHKLNHQISWLHKHPLNKNPQGTSETTTTNTPQPANHKHTNQP